MVDDALRAEQAATFAVLEAARSPRRLLGAQARTFARAPRRWLGAAALAWRMRPPGAKAALWQGFYLLEAGVLADRLHAIGADHLHNHFADSSCSVAMLAARIAGLPFSFTLHGPAEFFAPHHWRLDEKVARAAFVACISHFARSQAMLFSDQGHWNRLRIVHCGVDPDRLPARGPAAARAGAEAGACHVVFVGRLAGVKGAPLLLDALARLASDHPGLRATLVGDGPERPALEARAAALGLGDRVAFTGYLSQSGVADTLGVADMLVLPSFAEGVPVVLMEAMATGLPVVTTRIAGVPELVEDGVSGLLVAPGDGAGLARAMDALARDPGRAAAMGRAGRAKVVAEFALPREAAWLRRLLDGSLEGRLPDGLRPEASAARAAGAGRAVGRRGLDGCAARPPGRVRVPSPGAGTGAGAGAGIGVVSASSRPTIAPAINQVRGVSAEFGRRSIRFAVRASAKPAMIGSPRAAGTRSIQNNGSVSSPKYAR
nr:glycosyltransferase [Jannaschia sp. LMIT008]